MLKKRLIPILLLKEGRMVKTIKFEKMREVGFPVTAAKIYDAQGADELIFLDISASVENRNIMIDVIKQVATQCFIPFTAGGGIRTIDDIHNLLKAGVDKIAINTAAVENPDFIRKAAQKFGDQCIVVSIDAKKKEDGTYEVYTQGGKKATGLNPVEWAKEAEKLNAGEILITSIDCEGMMGGYDIQLIREVSDAISIPVIAHGGVGTLQHLVEGLREGKASAVAAASIFHFTDQSPIKARRFMKEAGIDVRTTF
jgi:cyclase